MSKYKLGEQVYVYVGSAWLHKYQIQSIIPPKHGWNETKYIVATDNNSDDARIAGEHNIYPKELGEGKSVV